MSRTDAMILLLACALVAGLHYRQWQPPQSAAYADVWLGEQRQARLPLNENRELRLQGPLGESRIEVRDGRARVAASPGRQQLCVRAGWLSEAGDTAVCLPNRVMLELGGGPTRFDAINF